MVLKSYFKIDGEDLRIFNSSWEGSGNHREKKRHGEGEGDSCEGRGKWSVSCVGTPSSLKGPSESRCERNQQG